MRGEKRRERRRGEGRVISDDDGLRTDQTKTKRGSKRDLFLCGDRAGPWYINKVARRWSEG